MAGTAIPLPGKVIVTALLDIDLVANTWVGLAGFITDTAVIVPFANGFTKVMVCTDDPPTLPVALTLYVAIARGDAEPFPVTYWFVKDVEVVTAALAIAAVKPTNHVSNALRVPSLRQRCERHDRNHRPIIAAVLDQSEVVIERHL